MITGAIIGALIFGGVAFAATMLAREPFWRAVAITAGIAIAGAGTIAGAVASIPSSRRECPPGTVQADANNRLYSGCIPVDLAQEVINLRDALGYLVEETRLAAENSDDVVVQKRVADAIKTTVAKIQGDHDE